VLKEIHRIRQVAESKMHDPFTPVADAEQTLPEGIDPAFELNRAHITAVEKIGQGQFGEVYLANLEVPSIHPLVRGSGNKVEAENGRIEVQVAVKTMRLTCTPAEVAEFTEEAKLQMRLQHENIAQLVGVCMAQTPMLAVLELILYISSPFPCISTAALTARAFALFADFRVLMMLEVSTNAIERHALAAEYTAQGKKCHPGTPPINIDLYPPSPSDTTFAR
jgi:hypothetical protein